MLRPVDHITHRGHDENDHEHTLRDGAHFATGVSSQEEQSAESHLLDIHSNK